MVIQHGNDKYCDNSDNSYYPIGCFLINELRTDQTVSPNPVHEKIFDEYLAHFCDPGFNCECFFINHPDSEIRNTLADLISESSFLSKLPIDINLPKEALRVICELKQTICEQEIERSRHAISMIANDTPEYISLLEMQNTLLKTLGALKNQIRQL